MIFMPVERAELSLINHYVTGAQEDVHFPTDVYIVHLINIPIIQFQITKGTEDENIPYQKK